MTLVTYSTKSDNTASRDSSLTLGTLTNQYQSTVHIQCWISTEIAVMKPVPNEKPKLSTPLYLPGVKFCTIFKCASIIHRKHVAAL